MNLLKNTESCIHWILRIASGLCFIGHGAFGIITKAGWLPYFAVVDIGPDTAYTLMPLIGIMDITIGISLLVFPTRIILLFMVVWAAWTAVLRPLAGQGIWEFVERAGNYGISLAFLIWAGLPKQAGDWIRRIRIKPVSQQDRKKLILILRITTALLLIGHGGFGAVQNKPMLMDHFAAIGLPFCGMDPTVFLRLVGIFEIVLGVVVLFIKFPPILLVILIWKLFTELLYPISGTPVWEFVERAGSYGAPLALWILYRTERN